MAPDETAHPALEEAEARNLSLAARAIGHPFREPALLAQALTHASRAASRLASNERMEFLGDAVVDLVACAYLYRSRPELLEGELTELRSAAVSRQSLAEAARNLGLQEYLSLGRGMTRRQDLPDSTLADAFEAVVGAVYLDGGFEPAESVVLRALRGMLDREESTAIQENYKSVLQERAQGRGQAAPEYRVELESGPDHRKVFHVTVHIDGEMRGWGVGASKKEAEQRAAKNALKREDAGAPEA
jgi:ribonuclease-3